MSRTIVIAAASARPFVRAAANAGYRVIAADAFCDADTRQAAAHVIQLGYMRGGFDAGDLRGKLFPLLAQADGFVYGSGLETQPELLDEIARLCPLLGNTAYTAGRAKDPGHFFPLLSRLGIPFPEISLTPPVAGEEWLRKRIGGSGGTHVTRLMPRFYPPLQGEGWGGDGLNYYYQRLAPGKPCSLLFLADGTQASAVGYNQQLLAPTASMPYRYGGVVSQAELPQQVRSGLLHAAQQLTAELGLRGLNSLDCMVDGDNYAVLEINPRLSASFALYDAANQGARLFEAHLRACAGELEQDFPPGPESAQAHLIYYAPFDFTVPAMLEWPDWVADVPAAGTHIQAGEPVCTVMASTTDASSALALARVRASELVFVARAPSPANHPGAARHPSLTTGGENPLSSCGESEARGAEPLG